jgi:single-strand DNA-binding protein
MASVNKVILIGRLGRDPELRTAGSTPVCNFSIATDEYAGKGKERRTEWHRLTAWDKVAENCAKYLKKGSAVYVEGRLQTREWEKDGVKRSTTEIVANVVQFLDSRPKGEQPAEAPAREPGSDDAGDVPF